MYNLKQKKNTGNKKMSGLSQTTICADKAIPKSSILDGFFKMNVRQYTWKVSNLPISATFLMVCLKAQMIESRTNLNWSGGISRRAEKTNLKYSICKFSMVNKI